MACNITKLGGVQISPHNHYSVKSGKQNFLQHLKFLQGILYPGFPWKKAWKTGTLTWLEGQKNADNLNQRSYEE